MLNFMNVKIAANALKNRIISKKSKGGINQTLALAVLCVILLIVEWPLVRTVVTNTWNTLTTWFSTNIGKVFTNLP